LSQVLGGFWFCFIEVFYRTDKEVNAYYFYKGEGRIMKRYALLSLALATIVIVVGFSATGLDNQSLICFACEGGGVVDKTS